MICKCCGKFSPPDHPEAKTRTRESTIAFIEETNGKFFTVRFYKRTNGEVRQMSCRTGVTKGLVENPSRPGTDFKKNNLVGVYDMTVKDYRSIPKEGIFAIKINGEWEEVI
jgi:hypothetical protein